MLERVAMHQTRLRTPGLFVDPKGVALGARLLISLASLERLVAFLSLYTESHSLGPHLSSLRIEVLRSSSGPQELVLSLDVTSSEQADAFAETARVVGGYCFTGTDTHYVQIHDAAAPFGYDVTRVEVTDKPYVLYHDTFTRTYDVDRRIDVLQLLQSLQLHVDSEDSKRSMDDVWVLAERGIGPAVIRYFVRWGVNASVGVVQWPPASALDDAPVERYLFRVRELPKRMWPLMRNTPGLSAFREVTPGAAVEVGYRHPIQLRAMPVFPPQGLVLFRGGNHDPLQVQKVPTMGPVQAFARIEGGSSRGVRTLGRAVDVPPARVQARLMPSSAPVRKVTAAHVAPDDYEALRKLAYWIPSGSLQRIRVAFTDAGAFLLLPDGVEMLPLGVFLSEIRPTLYIAAGYQVVPSVSDEVLFRVFGSPSKHVVFWTPRIGIVGVERSVFVSLQNALLEGQSWAPIRSYRVQPLAAPSSVDMMYEPPEEPEQSGQRGNA